MKKLLLALLPLGLAAAAFAQGTPAPEAAAPTPAAPAVQPAAPVADAAAAVAPVGPKGGTELQLRGLEKITGRPTNIVAPIGKPVQFATLTITARYCYSTPQSETPVTAAFVQIEDHRPNQSAKRIFSGWMYASSPGLNAMEHPLYDVWVINCTNGTAPAATASVAPVPVAAPDSSDKEQTDALPEDAGK